MENQFEVGDPVLVMGLYGIFYVESVPHGEEKIGTEVLPASPFYVVGQDPIRIEILPEHLDKNAIKA